MPDDGNKPGLEVFGAVRARALIREPGRADGAGGSDVRAFAGLLFAPHVAPCQHVSEDPEGNSA